MTPFWVRIAALAERYFPEDPVTTLMKLRQFGEMLAQQVAALESWVRRKSRKANYLEGFGAEAGYPREVIDLFHDLHAAWETKPSTSTTATMRRPSPG